MRPSSFSLVALYLQQPFLHGSMCRSSKRRYVAKLLCILGKQVVPLSCSVFHTSHVISWACLPACHVVLYEARFIRCWLRQQQAAAAAGGTIEVYTCKYCDCLALIITNHENIELEPRWWATNLIWPSSSSSSSGTVCRQAGSQAQTRSSWSDCYIFCTL